MTQILRQSTQVIVVIGPFVDVTDGFTPETGITLSGADEAELLKSDTTTTTSISGNTIAAITGCDGWYGVTLSTTDTNTCGALTIMVNDDSVCLPVFARFQVVEEAIFDAMFAASANAWSGAAGSTTVTALASGSITAAVVATGAIDADAIADNAIDAGALAADCITAAKIANGAIDAATFAADVDAEVLSYLVDDATRIDASALNTLSGHDPGEAIMGATDLGTGAGLTTLATQASVNTIDDFLDTEIAALTTAVADLPTNAELATALGTADDAVLAAIAALNNISVANILAATVEGSTTLVQALRLLNAALGGKASGLNTTTAVYRDVGDTKDRVTATVDADGNRTAVTLDLT